MVTGRDPKSPTLTGAVLTRLRLALHKNVGEGQISKSQKALLDAVINDEAGEAPKWLEVLVI